MFFNVVWKFCEWVVTKIFLHFLTLIQARSTVYVKPLMPCVWTPFVHRGEVHSAVRQCDLFHVHLICSLPINLFT